MMNGGFRALYCEGIFLALCVDTEDEGLLNWGAVSGPECDSQGEAMRSKGQTRECADSTMEGNRMSTFRAHHFRSPSTIRLGGRSTLATSTRKSSPRYSPRRGLRFFCRCMSQLAAGRIGGKSSRSRFSLVTSSFAEVLIEGCRL